MRLDNDNYPTPQSYAEYGMNAAIDILGKKNNLIVFEPGCGDYIPYLKAIDKKRCKVRYGVDIREAIDPGKLPDGLEDAVIEDGLDYLSVDDKYLLSKMNGKADIILTNPPYLLAQEFVTKSLGLLSKNGVAGFLLKLDFLGSIGRMDFFQSTPLHSVHVSGRRPSFINNATDAHNYGYFFWKNNYLEDPKISWFLV